MTGSPLAIMAARDISIEEAGEIGVGHEIDHLNITESAQMMDVTCT